MKLSRCDLEQRGPGFWNFMDAFLSLVLRTYVRVKTPPESIEDSLGAYFNNWR